MNEKAIVDKGVLNDDVDNARAVYFCSCVRYDSITVTETVTEIGKTASRETIVVASPPSSQMESLSDPFIVECRLIFTETVRLLAIRGETGL